MDLEHAVFAVDRHEILRAHEALHEAELLLGGVARGMEGESEGILLHVRAHLDELVDEFLDEGPVARDRV